jgi:hypothetical protein
MKWSDNIYVLEGTTFVPTKTSKYRDIKYEISNDLEEIMDGVYIENKRTLFIPESHPFFNVDVLNDSLVHVENAARVDRLRMKLKEARQSVLTYARKLHQDSESWTLQPPER